MTEAIVPWCIEKLRGQSWFFDDVVGESADMQILSFSCISDDAQGEQIEVLWDAEIGPRVRDDYPWTRVGQGGPDRAEVWPASR